MKGQTTLYLADAIADDRGVLAAPGAVLVRWSRSWPSLQILASGTPSEVQSNPTAADAVRVDLSGHVLTPGLVNAHAHLDLTNVGPQPFDPDAEFAHWLADIRRRRPDTETAIRDSVRRGVEMSLRGGCVAVGDIAGSWSLIPIDELRRSPLVGVSFLECFGLGAATESIARIDHAVDMTASDMNGVRLGLQPHAPFSAGIRLYRHAVRIQKERGVALATHLAESMSERELVVQGRGPIRSFLESLNLWTDESSADFGLASTAVSHLGAILGSGRWLVAHVNDCSDPDLEVLRDAGACVAYCPRASAYFRHEHEFGPHRYREMLNAGIPVALGTDSLVCVPAEQADRLSVLDEMRYLWRRDRTDPVTLLQMATTNGAFALGCPPDRFRLTPGSTSGLLAIPVSRNFENDPLAGALASDEPPKLLEDESGSRQTASRVH